MPYKPSKPKHEEGTDSWLMSYADMITLLLCFFIIFVSISEPKEKYLAAAMEGMQARFGSVNLANPFNAVFRSLEGVIDQYDLYRDATLERFERGMELEIASSRLFLENSAELNPENEELMQHMAEAFKAAEFADYTLVVEGHTSDAPLENHPKFASNWEFSAERAVSVVRALERDGIPAERLRAVGMAGAKPKLPNMTVDKVPIPENRTHNERILIRFERAKAE